MQFAAYTMPFITAFQLIDPIFASSSHDLRALGRTTLLHPWLITLVLYLSRYG